MLSVPLAVASPALADLPASAEPTLQVQKQAAESTVSSASNTSEITAAIPTATKPQRPESYRVRSGDTVSQIAKRFGVSVGKIARLNNLGPKSLIRVGQQLKLTGDSQTNPKVESYRVRPGDTLSGIASKHGLTLSELTALNRINSSTIIYPGQVLIVARVIPAAPPNLQNPDSYQVQAGDSLESIASKFSLKVTDLQKFNAFTKNSIIYVGQLLHLKQAPKPVAVSDPKPAAGVASTLSDEVSSLDPRRPSGACTLHGFHIVKPGETVSRIAAVYGVSTQAVLSENNLTWSSTIYVGQKLSIPGVHEIRHCPSITKLSPEMRTNAETIFRVGRSLQVSDFGIVIALATAMQESSLRNINFGDRDSVGLFQQRTSQGWGSVEQIMNPEYSARAFFGGPTGPNAGKIRGLLDLKNWSSMALSKAAQAVQISAHPDAYQKWELSAWSWLDELKETSADG